MERPLASLVNLRCREKFAPDRHVSRNQQILQTLENPPEDFDGRQELLDIVPYSVYWLNKDLFVSVGTYLKKALGIKKVTNDCIPEAVNELKRRKIVPVLPVSEMRKVNGQRQRVIRYKVLKSDFEDAIERRERIQAHSMLK